MKTRVVSATEFKAKCLAILDEIENRGESITITRRGRPVAVVGPAKKKAWKSPKDRFAGRVRIVGDIGNGACFALRRLAIAPVDLALVALNLRGKDLSDGVHFPPNLRIWILHDDVAAR